MTTLVNIIRLLTSCRTIVVIIMALALSFSLSAYAQEILWEKLNNKANTLFKEKRYSDALSVSEQALKVAED